MKGQSVKFSDTDSGQRTTVIFWATAMAHVTLKSTKSWLKSNFWV